MEVGIEGPYSATREGISETLGIKPNTFSHKVQPLIASKDVTWGKAHVLGFRKRVRIYRLSPQGLGKAERIIASIKELQVTIPNEFGERQALTVEQAMKRVGGKRGYLSSYACERTTSLSRPSMRTRLPS